MSQNVYEAPQARTDHVDFDCEPNKQTIYHLSGRIGRLRYLSYQMALAVIIYLIMGVLFYISAPNMQGQDLSQSPSAGILIIVLMLVLYIPILVYNFAFMVRRLHDLDKSGWLSLLMLVPFVNFFFLLYLLFGKGEEKSNRFGAPPRPNRWWHWVGGISVPVIFAIIGAIAIPAYQGYLEKAQEMRER